MAKKFSDLTAAPSVKNVFFKKKKLIADEAAAKLEAGTEAGAAAPDTQEVAPAASAESAATADGNNKAAALLPAEADAGLSAAAWWGIGGAAAIGGGIALSNRNDGGNKNNAVALKAPAASQTPLTQDGPFNVAGEFKITDLDVGNTLTVTAGKPIVAQTSGRPVPEGTADDLTPALALSGVPATTTGADITVGYVYSPESEIDLSFLAKDETLTVTYPVTVSDGASSFVYNVVVAITGTNDAPEVTAQTYAAAEDATNDGASLVVDLLQDATDVDVTDVLSVVANSITYTVDESEESTEELAGLSFDAETNELSVDATDESFQGLALGESRTIVVNYTITDDNGEESSTVEQSLTITINGTNDTPTVSAALTLEVAEDQPYVAPEEETTLTLSAVEKQVVESSPFVVGLLNGAADVDNGDVLSVVTDSITYTVGDSEESTAELAGLTFNEETNELSVDATDESFQGLALGESRTIVVNYTITDDNGEDSLTVDQSLTITINGTNDTPTVNAGLMLLVDEDELYVAPEEVTTVAFVAVEEPVVESSPFVVDLLDGASDADTTDVLSVVANSITYTVGDSEESTAELAGLTFNEEANELSVDATDESFQELALGETRVITVNYTITDDNGDDSLTVNQSLTITIAGTNDTPTVKAALTFSANEDDVNTDDSLVVKLLDGASDVDSSDILSVDSESFAYTVDGDSEPTSGLPAGLTFADNKLTVVTTDVLFQSLAQGETRTIVVNYTITDDNDDDSLTVDQSLTITVTGTNDAPVATFSNVSETGFSVQVDDIDNGAVVRLVQPVNGTQKLENHAPNVVTATVGTGITDQLINVVDQFDAESGVVGRVIQGTNFGDAIDITGVTSDTVIYGFNDNDNIVSGAGDDSIYGGDGNDTLTGGAGGDSVTGGAGNDTYVFAQNAVTGDTVSDASGTDMIRTTAANVDLSLLNAGNTLASAGIERVVIANNGAVNGAAIFTGAQLSGQSIIINEDPINNDATTLAINIVGTTAVNFTTLNFSGAAAADFDDGSDLITITGDDAANTITGTSFADSISGGAGNDTITGGDGNDSLSGGDGNDTFIYTTTSDGADVVSGFTTLSDVINVDAILNGTKVYLESTVNNSAFTTTNANVIVFGTGSGITGITAAALRVAGDNDITSTSGLIVFSDTQNTFVYHSNDLAGNGTETLLLTLQGIGNAVTLNANDFLFT